MSDNIGTWLGKLRRGSTSYAQANVPSPLHPNHPITYSAPPPPDDHRACHTGDDDVVYDNHSDDYRRWYPGYGVASTTNNIWSPAASPVTSP